MKKKLFISLLTIFNLIPLIGVPTALISLGFTLPNVYEDSFLGELKYKYDNLYNEEKNKIVFIGGSSIPFGIRSSYIEDYFKTNLNKDYAVIDFGMYAALGTKVMLDLAKNSIKSGDIVIIMPEQQSQTLSLYFNGKMMWQALDGRMSLFNNIDKEDKSKMIGDYPGYIYEKIDLLSTTLDFSDTVYARSSFDEYGDIASELCSYNTMDESYDKNMLIRFDNNVIEDDFISYLNEFNKDIKEVGATTFYHFCPMNRLAITGDVDNYYSYLNNKLEFDILGNPNDSILDHEYFYDSNFHLNNVGALLNTSNIIKDFKVIHQDSKPFNIDIPDKPKVEIEDLGNGNNSMLSYFEITKKEKNALIKELTNKNVTNITIPYSIDNLRISSFDEEVFKNNSKIQSITIQNNISSIPKNAFDGCTSLKKIILLNQKPSTINPGENFLGNCSATIYVPSNVVSLYKTNYFWSIYSNRIKPMEGDINL